MRSEPLSRRPTPVRRAAPRTSVPSRPVYAVIYGRAPPGQLHPSYFHHGSLLGLPRATASVSGGCAQLSLPETGTSSVGIPPDTVSESELGKLTKELG